METLLIIDDEEYLREEIVEVLGYEGYQTLSAGDGHTGLQLALQHTPDLILCDVMMPGINGYDVLEELRRDPVTAAIPFIFLTAISTRKEMRHGMTLGADDYLTKPFDVHDLLAAIRTRLDKRVVASQQAETLRLNLSQTLPHELQTPLTGILGMTEFLLYADPNSPVDFQQMREMLQVIHDSAGRLQVLVENYLFYAKLRMLEYEPEKKAQWRDAEPIQTSYIIRMAVERQIHRTPRQDDISIETVDGTIRMREDLLWKIMRHLVDNAVKFSEAGTPIRIRTQIRGDRWIMSIADQGRGMTREQIADVGAYMQFDRDIYEQQGSGLGLTIVRMLVHICGGELRIDSTPDQGTTVHVDFPVVVK